MGDSFLKTLTKKLPNDTLLNLGKNGDTIHGLYKRIKKLKLTTKPDLGFIWIGTNDILVQASSSYELYKKIYTKPWKTYQHELKKEYQKILEHLTKKIPTIITIPPALIGEDLNNRWNQELGEMAQMIENISKTYPTVEYFNLREIFITHISQRKPSKYLRTTAPSVLFDRFVCATPEDIDLCAQKRGLYLTLDGVHLNTKGAQIVADAFFDCIQKKLK